MAFTLFLFTSLFLLAFDTASSNYDNMIRKQAEDHKSLALAYASYARKLKLENSKLVRVFTDLSRK
uniref:Uncharacterized protein n=1 Tax=Vitis vinifera TaxID=29760 RepID=A5AFU3_VITVI|nr:hypothetical protein VITISV_015808 [Vitis vinifera]